MGTMRERKSGLAADLLFGREEIAKFFGWDGKSTRPTMMAEAGMPYFMIGTIVCGRKSRILAWIEELERKESSPPDATDLDAKKPTPLETEDWEEDPKELQNPPTGEDQESADLPAAGDRTGLRIAEPGKLKLQAPAEEA